MKSVRKTVRRAVRVAGDRERCEKEPRRVRLAAEPVKEFFDQSLERARKLDRGERLAPEISIAFEDPAELAQLLSTERVRLIRAVRPKPVPLSELAAALGRDRKAVTRDVALLQSFGLLKTRSEANPGHGRRTIVAPLAAKYQLIATI